MSEVATSQFSPETRPDALKRAVVDELQSESPPLDPDSPAVVDPRLHHLLAEASSEIRQMGKLVRQLVQRQKRVVLGDIPNAEQKALDLDVADILEEDTSQREEEIETDRARTISVITSALSLFYTVLEHSSKKGGRIPEPLYRRTLNTAASVVRTIMIEDMKKHKPRGVEISDNPYQRPLSEIIEEGITLFQNRNPKAQISYKRNEEYFSFGNFIALLKKRVSVGSDPKDTHLRRIITGLVCGRQDILVDLIRTLKDKFPATVSSKVASAKNYATFRDTSFYSLAALIQTISSQTKSAQMGVNPVSYSVVLSHALERTSGDLGKALRLTADCLKYIARPMEFTEERREIEKELRSLDYDGILGTGVTQKLIQDEYSDVCPYYQLSAEEAPYPGRLGKSVLAKSLWFGTEWSEQEMMKNLYYDFSLPNQEGKPYHAAYMAALLDTFPAEMVISLSLGEYVPYGGLHGLSKFLADLRVAADLRRTEEVLKKYEQSL